MTSSSEEILINMTPQETRVALVAHGFLEELHVERANDVGIVGNIYSGKVLRILPGMQSAFIDIGLERKAFLHVADLIEYRRNCGQALRIETILREGQYLMVQVIKDALGSKGPRVSSQISLAGRVLVFLPQDDHIGVSQKIEGESVRESLRQRLLSLLGERLPQSGGFILRTMAEHAADTEIHHDVSYLQNVWREIQLLSQQSKGVQLLHRDLLLCHRVLRDLVNEDTQCIWVDCPEGLRLMAVFAQKYMPALFGKLKYYDDCKPLFSLFDIEKEIEGALLLRVNLASGGYIMIEQTEAMTTIDVNTGGFVGTRDFEDTILKTNLEAARVLARQLRLRNLGGIIMIDFIDMGNIEHQKVVLAQLEQELARDRSRVTVGNFSRLGLVEMTRKRTRESLSHMLCEPCVRCSGRGVIKTISTVCYQILRELLVEAHQSEQVRGFRVITSSEVVNYFLDTDPKLLLEIELLMDKRVVLQPELSYGRDQFDIVFLSC